MRGETYDTTAILIRIVISYLNPILIAAQASRAAIRIVLSKRLRIAGLQPDSYYQSSSRSIVASRKLLLLFELIQYGSIYYSYASVIFTPVCQWELAYWSFNNKKATNTLNSG